MENDDTVRMLQSLMAGTSGARYCKGPLCSNPVEGAPSKLYCSKLCKNRARRPANYQMRKCPICSKMFEPVSGRQRFCSATCNIEHTTRQNRKRYNEVLFIVKDLEREFAALKSRNEQHEFCATLLKKAKTNNKIRQAITGPGFVKFFRHPTSKDAIYRAISRKPPKKATNRTIIVIAPLNLEAEIYDNTVKACPGFIPERRTYFTYLGSFTPRIAEIKMKQFEEIMAVNDSRTALLVDYGFYEPDLEKALEFERLLNVSDDMHEFLISHTKYIHGMLPHEYLRKTPRPSMNLISDFTDYID